jgi:hypothetical protein
MDAGPPHCDSELSWFAFARQLIYTRAPRNSRSDCAFGAGASRDLECGQYLPSGDDAKAGSPEVALYCRLYIGQRWTPFSPPLRLFIHRDARRRRWRIEMPQTNARGEAVSDRRPQKKRKYRTCPRPPHPARGIGVGLSPGERLLRRCGRAIARPHGERLAKAAASPCGPKPSGDGSQPHSKRLRRRFGQPLPVEPVLSSAKECRRSVPWPSRPAAHNPRDSS